jgi:ribosomal protein L21E
MAGLGIQKRGVRIARVLKAEGGSATEDMSPVHEAMEPEIEEARETKLEKEGYKETKAGKMIKDVGRGIKEGARKFVKASTKGVRDVAEGIEKVANSETMKKIQKQVRDANIGKFDKEIFYKKFAKGGQAKVSKVMREFGKGKLHSGKKGPVVKSRKQAIAIALSEAGKSKKK